MSCKSNIETNPELGRSFSDYENSLSADGDQYWRKIESHLDANVDSNSLVADLLDALYAIDDPRGVLSRNDTIESEKDNRFWFELVSGILSFHMGLYHQGKRHFHEAARQRPTAIHAQVLLNVLQSSQQWKLTIAIAERLLSDIPNEKFAWLAIGRASRKLEAFDQAVQQLEHAQTLFPDDAEVWCEIGFARLESEDFEKAAEAFQKALAHQAGDLTAITGCFLAFEMLGVTEKSARMLDRMGGLEQSCEQLCEYAMSFLARHGKLHSAEKLIARRGSSLPKSSADRWIEICQTSKDPTATPPQLSSKSIADEFDRRADTFEDPLQTVNYRGHEIAKQFLLGVLEPSETKLDVLDMGCGMGACGEFLRPFANSITGVDISPKMIRRAQWQGNYDQLYCDEFENYLKTTDQRFDWVFANDALVCSGSLGTVLAGISRVLKPDGRVVFDLACQEPDDAAPIILGWDGRYRHSLAYAQQALTTSGLQPRIIERRVPQLAGSRPVFHFMTYAEKISGHQNAVNSHEPVTQFRDRSPIDEKALYQDLCVRKPQLSEAHLGLGNAELALGNPTDAIVAFEKSLNLKAGADGFTGLGNALVQRGDLPAALKSFQSAVECDPKFLPALNNAGRAAQELGMVEIAKQYLLRTLAEDPDNTKAHSFLGMLYDAINEVQLAIHHYENSLGTDSRQPEILLRLGRLNRRTNNFSQAMNYLVQAQQLLPQNPQVYANLGETNVAQGRITEAGFCFLRALQLNPDDSRIHSSLIGTMLCEPAIGGNKLLEEATRWNSIHAAATPACNDVHATDKSLTRRLRIGLVSPELDSPAFRSIVATTILNLDKAEYDVIGYANLAAIELEFQELVGDPGILKPTSSLSDRELAESIVADKIDILIDLAGHSPGNRLLTFAMRPAPIQMTWLGYPATTGLSSIDYILADRHTIPENQRGCYSETPLYLPDCYLSFECSQSLEPLSELPSARTGKITFGCFSSMEKITANVISVWAKLLLVVPGSRLYLKNEALSDEGVKSNLELHFGENGISKDRLWLEGSSSAEPSWQDFSAVDIALDPFPVSDVVSSLNFLSMGIPVVTKAGIRFSANTTSSVLTNMGLDNWSASNAEDYVDLARTLSLDLPDLVKLRRELRSRLTDSKVCDTKRFIDQLQMKFREVWCNWCDPAKTA